LKTGFEFIFKNQYLLLKIALEDIPEQINLWICLVVYNDCSYTWIARVR